MFPVIDFLKHFGESESFLGYRVFNRHGDSREYGAFNHLVFFQISQGIS